MKLFLFSISTLILLSACATQNVPTMPETKPVLEEAKTSLSLGLIALDYQGDIGPLIGCGDSLVFVTQDVVGTLVPELRVKTALENLLAIKSNPYGESGLSTALDAVDLKVDSVVLNKLGVTVALSGDLSSRGVCEDPRIVAQLKETVKINSGVGDELSVTILVNGISLDEFFNEKGE